MALTRPRYSNIVDTDYKASCRVVTTTNITLSSGAPSTYDGVTLAAGDRVLVAGQNTGSQNGIYVVLSLGTGSNGTWIRAFDANEGDRISAGLQTNIGEGTYGGRNWRLTTPDPIIIGTTELTFQDAVTVAGGANQNLQYNNNGYIAGITGVNYIAANTTVVATGNVYAGTVYTDQLRWAANSQAVTLTGNINPTLYIGSVAATTATTLIDTLPVSGNLYVKWNVVSKDTVNNRYRFVTIDTVNDGTSVYYSEYAGTKSNPSYNVAVFTSNISSGNINLWAVGDSASVTVNYQRTMLGSSTPTGYINNFGPIGPAGTIAGTSSNIVTTATSAATSTTTGALQIAGGAGIAGNIYVGENAVIGTDLTVLGNLSVLGEVTTFNTATLTVEDLNVTLANGAATSGAANGAGISVSGPAGAQISYFSSSDAWNLNKNTRVTALYTGSGIFWAGNSAVVKTGIQYTTSDVAPTGANYGDKWYDTGTDILYEWQTGDGANGFWVDIGSLAIQANANLSNQAFNTVSANNVVAAGNISAGNIILGGVGSGAVYANNFVFSQNGASIFDSFGVNSYGNVNVAQYLPKYTGNLQAANVYVVGNDSTSISTGALRVVGGVGVNGNLFVDGSGDVNGGIAVTGSRGQISIGNDTRDGVARYVLNTAVNLYSGMQIKRAGTELWFAGANQAEKYVVRYNGAVDYVTVDTTGNLVIATTTSSTNTTTGALVVRGGAGIAGAVNIGTGLTVDGGAYGNVATTQFASVYGQAYGPNPYSIMQVRSNDFTTGMGIQTYAGLNGLLYSNTGIQFNTGSNVRDKDFPTGGVNAGQFAANGAFIALTGIASTSTGTGAVIVTGGAGIAGNTYIGANLVVTQSGLFQGPYNESSTLSGVFVGNTGAGVPSPRVGFFNGNTQQNWQIDNFGGAFRWFVPGTTKMTLYDTGILNVTGGYTVGGKKAVNGPAFRAYITTGQTIAGNGTQQKVTFGGETFDTDGCFASSAFTPTAEGYYQLNATVRIAGTAGTGENMLVLYKNGGEYARGTNGSGTEIGANFYSMQVSDIVYANGTTDFFEVYIQQGSGSNRDTTAGTNISYFSGCMIRGA
jgi:predicted acyltransferase (DUF342 family)